MVDSNTFNDAILKVRNLAFSYGQKPVLKDINLDVRPGTCLCLMGVNGCGKSTLLDCILGEHQLLRGQVEIANNDCLSMDYQRRAELISYVPQTQAKTFPYLVEHIVLMGRAAKSPSWANPSDEDLEKVHQALETCGIRKYAQCPYTQLSGGETQMVMLARALVQDTPVMIMDEPTAHLDFKNELIFLETVEHLVLNKGTTVLMATHNPNQAFHLQTAGVDVEVAVMSEGEIIGQGLPEDILTEDLLKKTFSVDARIAQFNEGRMGFGAITQIIPLHTTDFKKG